MKAGDLGDIAAAIVTVVICMVAGTIIAAALIWSINTIRSHPADCRTASPSSPKTLQGSR